jgi:hypothetical protein
MVNGKMPLYLTALAVGFFCAVVILVQPYSADWPGTGYTQTARQYVRAALREDSTALIRLSASLEPVNWALNAARAHRDSLALWGRRIQAWTGERWGDTAEVYVYPQGDVCGDAPLVLWFVGHGDKARVLRASTACWSH